MPELAPCGTRSAYARHLRRKEPVDDACRTAARAAQRAAAARLYVPRDRSSMRVPRIHWDPAAA